MTTMLLNPLIAPIFPTEITYASPLIQPPQDPTPVATQHHRAARSRRTYGSSSDSAPTRQNGFIETDLRAGGPMLCESPCETLHKFLREPQYYNLQPTQTYALMTELRDICQREDVYPSDMQFCGRRSVYEPHRAPELTLLIVASRSDVSRVGTMWLTLARKLFHLIRGKNLTDKLVSVEIVDERFARPPLIHPCQPHDTIFPIWQRVALEIFNTIDTTGVFTIGCFRIGSHRDRRHCPSTVLLGVDRSATRDWKQVREQVVAVLEIHELTDVAVTIHKDNHITGGSDFEDSGVTPRDCRINPNLGSSISPASIKDANGTLGGWVEIQNPKTGTWLPFAITCSHCCLPSESSLSPKDLQLVQKWKQEGVKPAEEDNKTRLLPVNSPSHWDIEAGKRSLKASIDQDESNHVYRQVQQLRSQDEFVLPYLEKRWEIIATSLAKSRKELNHIRAFVQSPGIKLGTVLAASGLREAPSADKLREFSIRDWALIMPGNSRAPGDNTLTIPPGGPNLTRLTDFAMELPEDNQPLYKTGRATGYTAGEYGNLRTCRIATRIVNGERVSFPTWEHVIVRPGRVVVKAGDAGSLIFDRTGAVMGMLFGGAGTNEIGYFTAARDLLEDIKRITGVHGIRLYRAST
ncbi:hypothetical protein BDW74DRAFT_165573 [Aspergillus multicolor]|uniref:uncharacterized protein n=1 Tax=Aspergillus multicolor TaxID=41759 RepID=UPI003CCDF735